MDAKTVLKGITRPVAPVALAAKLLSLGIDANPPENQPLFVTAVRTEEYADDTAHGSHVPKSAEVRSIDLRQMTSGAGQYFAPRYFAPAYFGHLGGMQRPPSAQAT